MPAATMGLREVAAHGGGFERLFLLEGDGLAAPVARLEGAEDLPQTPGTGRLRLLHFNDLHNHLTDLSGASKGTPRLAQMVKRVRSARRDRSPDEAVLFLSIGDDHTGTLFDELMGWTPDEFVLDASYRAFSSAGLDLAALGNHEFDRGTELLAMGIRQDAKFPILCANAHSSAHLTRGQDYHPAAIAIAGGLRIGLLGLISHIETRTGQTNDPDFAVESPLLAVKNILPALAQQVDIVLILSHCGYGDGVHQSGKATAARQIGEADFSIAKTAAALTDKPVLLLGAHTHTLLNENGFEDGNNIAGIPIFQAGCNGQHLGEIDLDVLPHGRTEFRQVCLHPITTTDDHDQTFETEHIAPMIVQLQGILQQVITTIDTDQLGFQTGVLTRYAGDSALLNFLCDAQFAGLKQAGVKVDFVMMNGATTQAGLEPGPLNMGDWVRVIPYADQVFIVEITSAQLTEILHSNARRILRPDEIPHTDYTGFLPRGFAHFSAQLRYRIRLGGSAKAAKADQITVQDKPLNGGTFRVAMPTYLALGAFGENWNGRAISGGVTGDLAGFDLRGLPHENASLVYRDVIADHMRKLGQVETPNGGFCDGRLVV